MSPRRSRAGSPGKVLIALAVVMLAAVPNAPADPVVNFFKSIGRTMSKPAQKPVAKPRSRREKGSTSSATHNAVDAPAPTEVPAATIAPVPSASPMPSVATTPTAPPANIARASVINTETHSSTRDVPYAIPVPNRAGFVTSPYAPNQGMVDVRGFRTGTEVKDPFTGKFFLIP